MRIRFIAEPVQPLELVRRRQPLPASAGSAEAFKASVSGRDVAALPEAAGSVDNAILTISRTVVRQHVRE